MTRYIYILITITSIFFLSCDRPPCTNDNPIFEAHAPDSKAYKDELVKQLDLVDRSKLTYWLQRYEDQNGEESLYFYIQGDGLCAVLHLTMEHWDKMEAIREQKGVGRRGAEFRGLTYHIVQDSITTKFVYETYGIMID